MSIAGVNILEGGRHIMDELILETLKLHLKDRFLNKMEFFNDYIILQLQDGRNAKIEIKQLKTKEQKKIY